MKVVVQRCKEASVAVDGSVISSIGYGMMVLVGVDIDDTEEDAKKLASKTVSLRIFNDESGVMNRSVADIEGEVLAVSQFTLLASTRKGNRPSYIRAAGHEPATRLYNLYCSEIDRLLNIEVKKGIFGADMKVSLINDGPVTIIMDTNEWKK